MKQILETERLYLRELEPQDAEELSKILRDKDSMKYYPRPFTEQEVEIWINRNIESYKKHNFGLWAVIAKENKLFLGECGITLQDIDGELLPELGCHINKHHCNKSYATEAAKECIRYAFETLGLETLHMYTSTNNLPSIKVAAKTGMQYIKSFKKVVCGLTVDEVLYSINKQNIS